jgi:hypothetical protein
VQPRIGVMFRQVINALVAAPISNIKLSRAYYKVAD